MIKLRGGFVKANFPPSIQRLIAWYENNLRMRISYSHINRAEISAANVLSADPGILSSSSGGLSLPSYKCTASPRGPMVPIANCPDYLVNFTARSRSMADIFANLRFLSGVLELKHPFSIAQIDAMWYSDKVYLVQRDLVYLWLESAAKDLDSACSIAASIYVDAYMRDLGLHTRGIAVMIGRLRSVLETNIVPFQLEHDDYLQTVVLWVLTIGGIAARRTINEQWFVDHLRSAYEGMNLQSQGDIENVLRKILWSKDWSSDLGEILKMFNDLNRQI
jgi:hypothetical protein